MAKRLGLETPSSSPQIAACSSMAVAARNPHAVRGGQPVLDDSWFTGTGPKQDQRSEV